MKVTRLLVTGYWLLVTGYWLLGCCLNTKPWPFGHATRTTLITLAFRPRYANNLDNLQPSTLITFNLQP
ncbi:MAG: hypothetical protein F6K50_11885 [Moorea sp. SIO3I7]|uniref:hypothetical protein n=1 Tax=unclassified Moorena TaxID=2683338 RepID=UPI0013C1C9AE|nr:MULTISPECIES: hypothetical protein [unclassified Moorena]NEN96206.1 hypothetical protein [Moorena sp. SIO3I7]NEO07574.1 hypothetical protein [Moorena sp. SIO3I8]NEO18260.1 hypothetical protein [Moorena sp. SIO4A5]NEP24912.1 hypothetical protein [Moorena sp. SIO3I6]NEQ57351.1 hypothetical protein [Moorena sp. SIO4A1]